MNLNIQHKNRYFFWQVAVLACRCSFAQMCFKKGAFENFVNFSRKYVLESPFKKVAGLKPCNFIKKETPTQVFSSEISEIFKKTFF